VRGRFQFHLGPRFGLVAKTLGVPSLMITLTLGDLHFSWQDRF